MGVKDLNPGCLRQKHQNVSIKLQGSRYKKEKKKPILFQDGKQQIRQKDSAQ